MKKTNLYDEICCQLSSDCHESTYLLLDHAGCPGLRSRLKATSLEWKSLFDNTGESSAVEAGPILVLVATEKRLLASKRFLDWIVESASSRSAIMMLSSPLNIDILCTCLTDRLKARLAGEVEVMLRFYDPRVFEALTNNLDESQRNWFFSLASKWWFVNRLGEVMKFNAKYCDKSIMIENIIFTQAQEDALLMESEVDQVLNTLRNSFAELMNAMPNVDQYQGVIDALGSRRNETEYSLDDVACQAAESFLGKRNAGYPNGSQKIPEELE